MIDKIADSRIQDILGRSSAKQPESAKTLSDSNADVSIQVEYASLINKAMQIQHSDTDAVVRARRLLLSSQLDSPQNIRAAAENIVTLGV